MEGEGGKAGIIPLPADLLFFNPKAQWHTEVFLLFRVFRLLNIKELVASLMIHVKYIGNFQALMRNNCIDLNDIIRI